MVMEDFARRVEALEHWKHSKDNADMQTAIRIAVLENDMKEVKDSIKDINEDTKWLRRTITQCLVGGTLTAIVAIAGFLIQRGLH
jgi:hypothetical protein